MTSQSTKALVLRDSTGSYEMIPRAVLEEGCVPAEREAELESLLTDDTAGHWTPAVPIGVLDFATLGPERSALFNIDRWIH